jgi:hypothetical protein
MKLKEIKFNKKNYKKIISKIKMNKNSKSNNNKKNYKINK